MECTAVRCVRRIRQKSCRSPAVQNRSVYFTRVARAHKRKVVIAYPGGPCDLPGYRTVFPWASYQIRKIAGCACAGNAGNVFPRRWFKRKPLVSDPGMHHGTCVTHVPWCMSGSLICGDGENVPGIPSACAPAILRIWQEAHSSVHGWGHPGIEAGCVCAVKCSVI